MTIWNTNLVSLQGVMLMLAALILSGCSMPFWGGYGAHGQTKDEFSRYVEGVFRLENSMTSEIMEFLENEGTNKHDDLLAAEHRMDEACGPLNEYASRESEGLSIGVFLSRRVEQTVSDCEQAALKVKSLLGH